MGSSSEPSLQDGEGTAESDGGSVALLRELVGRLSTKDGKTINWTTLVKILQQQDPSKSEDLGRCLSDGCRVIRELPARTLPKAEKDGKSRSSFRFEIPNSMRCIPETDVGLQEARDRDGAISFVDRTSSNKSSDGGKPGREERCNVINKKRKSLREQPYSWSAAALKDNDVPDGGLVCDGGELEEDELSEEDQHDFDANIHGDCERSACDSLDHEEDSGMGPESERRGSGWHRCEGIWQPFSRTGKAKRRLAIQARLRARLFFKSRNEQEKEESGPLAAGLPSSAAATLAIAPEVDKKGSGRKPSRAERRTAALRNAKEKPSLAELRARNGKSTPVVTAKEAKAEKKTITAAVVSGDDTSLPVSAPSRNSKSRAPTCPFTFTSRSMAANRLVVMRAELNHLRRNLEEARKEFQDLQRQESEASKQRMAEGASRIANDDSMLRAANTLHDRLKNSANALSALSSEAAQTQAQVQIQTQGQAQTQTVMASQGSKKTSTQAVAATMTAGSPPVQKTEDRDAGRGHKGDYVGLVSGKSVVITEDGEVTPSTQAETGRAQLSSKLQTGKMPSPLRDACKREPLSAATAVLNSGLADKLIDGACFDASPEQSPRPPRAVSSTSPSQQSPQVRQPPLVQLQKSPPPLSRRKKANMANIHHISNHKPSRQLKDVQPGVSTHTHLQKPSDSIAPGLDHPTSTTSLFSDEWMCVFCEYKLLYGEYPRMMGAVKSRKKLVAKKKEAQDRAHRATTVGVSNSAHSRAQCTCGRAHAKALDFVAKEFGMDDSLTDHDHDPHSHHHHHHHHHHSHDQDHNDNQQPLGEGMLHDNSSPKHRRKSGHQEQQQQHNRPSPQRFTYETATMKLEVQEVQDLQDLSRFHAFAASSSSSPCPSSKSTNQLIRP